MPSLILIRPILSEKAVNAASKGIYTFEVVRTANKTQIRKAVEAQFGVKVAKIWTLNSKSEVKRQGQYYGLTKPVKKAHVLVKDGTIDLWAPPEKSQLKTEGKKRKEK